MGFVSILFGILSSDATLQDELSSTGNTSIVYFVSLVWVLWECAFSCAYGTLHERLFGVQGLLAP